MSTHTKQHLDLYLRRGDPIEVAQGAFAGHRGMVVGHPHCWAGEWVVQVRVDGAVVRLALANVRRASQ